MLKSGNKSVRAAVGGCALLCAASLAHAQSSVSLYGIVDASLLVTSRTRDSASGANDGTRVSLTDSGLSPSMFGLTGKEDLGGGLVAEFKLENGLNIANGGYNNSNGNLFGRQAWLALHGGFGEVKAGLQYSPFFLALYDLDPRGCPEFGSGLVPYLDNVVGTGVFNANALTWTSPALAGFQGRAMIALGGEAGNFQAGRQYSLSLRYDNGTLAVEGAFYDGNGGGTVATPLPTTVPFVGRTLGASYKIGSLTAKASFASYKVAGGFSNNVYGGGLDYFVLPQFDVNGGAWLTSDRHDTGNHSILAAVGANYLLSRTTTLYAQIGVVNNHGAMNTGLDVDGASVDSALYGTHGTTVGGNVGIRHMF
ncbi:porin [Paraburkholderia oxyphila]|uniref:porin n=1 Tax=Paraburkholderia oxyphila TaxID=614212 RepID=UPI0005B95568|nr:porin [Paraburkholderia oxyphila]